MEPAPTRSDARRSRQLLLDAGVAALTEHGLDVQVSEITRRAGLAKGTFFRHFPTKRNLLLAILARQVRRQIAVAQSLLADPADDKVERYMTQCAADLAPVRGIVETAVLNEVDDPSLRSAVAELVDTLEPLLAEAKARGEVRDDLTPMDLQVLLLAATSTSAHFFYRDNANLWRRYLAITLDALRPDTATPLPVPAPVWQPSTSYRPLAQANPDESTRTSNPRRRKRDVAR
jgi:AcrR family transcriptional regulator